MQKVTPREPAHVSTSKRSRPLVAALCAAGSIACLPAPALADAVISPDPTATEINAYGGAVAWSRQVGGRFALVVRRSGTTRDAPVAQFDEPINADLGPTRSGRVVAVYRRCRSSGCDLFQLDLGSGRERKIRSLKNKRRVERGASTWLGRYAFGVAPPSPIARHGSGLYVGPPPRRVSLISPSDTDLNGRRLTLIAETINKDGDNVSSLYTHRVTSRRSRPCLIAAGGSPSHFSEHLESPTILGDFVYWLRAFSDGFNGYADQAIHRMPLPTAKCTSRGRGQVSRKLFDSTPLAPRSDYVDSVAIDGNRFYSAGRGGVIQLSDLQFRP